MQVFADSKESLESTLHFLKCYSLAYESVPVNDTISNDIDTLRASGGLTKTFKTALSVQSPLAQTNPHANPGNMAQRLALYLRRPTNEIDTAFYGRQNFQEYAIPVMHSPTIEGSLYQTSINIAAENPIIDHYALSQGMFVLRSNDQKTASIYSNIELAAQQTSRMAVFEKVQEIMQYADPMANHHS